MVQSASEIAASTEVALQTALSRVSTLSSIVENNALRNDRSRSVIGLEVEHVEKTTSPHENLKSLILGQGDLAKRQVDIAKFVAYYTRSANDGEDEYWLYCIDTSTKLLPTFIAKLANVFNENGDYIQALAEICKNQGTISDDGDSWVDKHSGYTIMAVDFNGEEETFGVAAVGRDVLQVDMGESIIKSSGTIQEFQSVEATKISNIVKSLSGFLGIDLSESMSFIMRASISSLGKSMPAKEAYDRAVEAAVRQGKKKMDSFETAYDASILIITLCYILIAIQTSIPSLITRKTHPGCKRGSLFKNTGYPLDGSEDKSGLIYIACIANKIKSSVEPWNSIRRLSENGIAKKMDATLSKVILKTDEVKERIREKLNYISLGESGAVPLEHDLKTWSGFLPALVPVKVKALANVSSEFKNSLTQNLKKGSNEQFEKIDVMNSKIIFYSLAIQESIQAVVSKSSAILANSVGEPFLENSCCDDGDSNTLRYFTTKEPSIIQHNNIVIDLANILDDLTSLSKASILFDPKDTKFRYPRLAPEFSEETIYRAFIVYCKYNSHIPISEQLRAICMDKPVNFNNQDSIDLKIKKLKSEGKVFSPESLDELMSIVNNQNLVHLNLQRTLWSNTQMIIEILEAAEADDSEALPAVFRGAFSAALGSVKIDSTSNMIEDTSEIRNFKNYLDTTNNQMMREITNFVSQNSTNKIMKSFNSNIARFTAFTETDNNSVRMVNFMKRTIRQVARILPTIITNKVDYTNTTIPRHWNLSERHTSDIKDFVRRYYAPLIEFYGDTEIASVIKRVTRSVIDIQVLSELTYCELPLINGDTVLVSIFGERTCSLLFRFYFISIMFEYMRSLEDMESIITTIVRPVGIDDDDDDTLTTVQIAEANTGNITEVEMIAGERQVLGEKLTKLIVALVDITCGDKGDLGIIDYGYDTLMERILRSKEKEKDQITNYLREMSDEEREVENLFKNHKLGMWGVGQQKGFRTYQGDTYDTEREAMEKHALTEMKLNDNNLVTEMNRDIYAMDHLVEEAEKEFIEMEENDLGLYVGENDDHGDYDGDEIY